MKEIKEIYADLLEMWLKEAEFWGEMVESYQNLIKTMDDSNSAELWAEVEMGLVECLERYNMYQNEVAKTRKEMSLYC